MSDSNTEEKQGSGVSLDQIVVSRDEEGLIVPEEVYVEEFGDTVVARPMNNAAQEKYIQPFIEAISATSAVVQEDVDLTELSDDEKDELKGMTEDALTPEMLAEMYEEHIVEPDLVAAYQANHPDEDIDGLDERFVREDLRVGAEDGLLFAILLVSDMDELVDALRSVGQQEQDEDDEEGGNE